MINYDMRFPIGSSHLVVGPPGSGKTYKIIELLKNKDVLIRNGEKIQNIIFCYARWQSEYNAIKSMVRKWVKKLPSNEEYYDLVKEYRNDGGSIVVVDDFMSDIGKDLVEIVTVTNRHTNTCLFLLFQSLFPSNPLARQISLNVRYIHIHKNPRENAQVQYLARQIQPKSYKWIIDSYHEATKKAYSSFLIDLNQDQDENLHFRSQILPSESPMIVWMENK